MELEKTAQKMGMSARNLQLKLKQEGQTFSKIKDQVRKEVAISFLKNSNESICDIAFLLNFSEQSAFTKAFKQWSGKTPMQFRQSV